VQEENENENEKEKKKKKKRHPTSFGTAGARMQGYRGD
jgi:hypothetical protein